MSRIRRLLRELHTRSVWQVLATYVGMSWLVLEIAEHMIGQWGLPEQAYPIAFLFLLLGLPFVVATAWLQDEPWQRAQGGRTVAEGEPSSHVDEPPQEAEAGGGLTPRRIFTWKNAALGGMAGLLIWGMMWMGTVARGDAPFDGAGASFGATWPSADREYDAALLVKILDDQSPDGSLGHLAEGITDQLIHALNQNFDRLRVPSFTTSVALADSVMSAPAIAGALGVDHLIEGSLVPQRDSVRLILQLIDAERDTHEWSLEFRGALADPVELRERVARVVTDSIASHLPRAGRLSGQVLRGGESPAHDAFLSGKRALGHRTSAAIREAIETLHDAIALDSSYAPAYAALSSAYALSVTYRTDLPIDAYTSAAYSLRLANRAIELDPELASAHAARGYVSSVSFAPVSVVLPDFRRAMDLEPDAPEVPGWFAHLLVREGRIEEALDAARTAAELSPLAPGRRLGLAYEALHAREFELAVSEARAASRLQPDLRLSAALEARALFLSGRAEECLELTLGPYEGSRALCLYGAGRRDQAEAVATELRRRVEAGRWAVPGYSIALPTEDLAVYYAGTGQIALALEWLQRTFRLTPSGVDSRTLESGLFDRLLEDVGVRDELRRLREDSWTRVRRLADYDEAVPRPERGG